MGVGTAVWWTYRLWVDAGELAQGPGPALAPQGWSTLAARWAEVSARTGHGLLPVALPALCVWAFAPKASEPRRSLAGWGLLAAVVGALSGALPALVAAGVALAFIGLPRRPRTGGEPLRAVPRTIAWTSAVLLAVSLAYELSLSLRLLRDLHP
jgi:hypothetical protein